MIARVLLLVAGLAQADTEPYARFSAAWATLDAERVSRIYAEDAIYLPPAGDYTIVTTDPDGRADTFRGKFLKVWRRDADGVWRIQTDSYSPAPER
jgi:ketosteroid isomerase-like protein